MKENEINLFHDIPLYTKIIEDRKPIYNDITDLPFFSKDEIARNFPSGFMNRNLEQAISKEQVEYATTSGTSGLQLNIIREKFWWTEEYKRAYGKNKTLANITKDNPRIALLTTAVCSSGVCYITNPTYQERINGFFLSLNTTADPNTWAEKDILRIHNEMNEYQPGVLQVDPFYLLIFLQKWKRYFPHKKHFQPQAIVFSYEYLSLGCKKFISENYQCCLFSAFGSTELGFLFIENENHDMVRTTRQEIIEFIPIMDNIFEISVTSWKNKFMPFMRYLTGDLIEIKNRSLLNPGRIDIDNFGSVVFHGRKKDMFYDTSEKPISIATMDHTIFQAAPELIMYKIKITITGDLIIEGIIKDQKGKNKIESSLSKALLTLDTRIRKVSFIPVHSISPSISGKYSLLVR